MDLCFALMYQTCLRKYQFTSYRTVVDVGTMYYVGGHEILQALGQTLSHKNINEQISCLEKPFKISDRTFPTRTVKMAILIGRFLACSCCI